MSRLDRHIRSVQTRMMLTTALRSLAWAGIFFAVAVWAAILIDKTTQLRLPHQVVWFWVGLGVAVTAALAFTFARRPSRQQAAIAIDEKLALKEKFITAIYVRPSTDPFAMAALVDAEKTADSVTLQNKFHVRPPVAGLGTLAVLLGVFLTAWLLPTFDLLGREAKAQAKAQEAKAEQRQLRERLNRAKLEIEEAPKIATEKPEVRQAKDELIAQLRKPMLDPVQAERTAQRAVQEVQKALKDKIEQNKDYAVTQQELKDLKDTAPADSESGPVADAHRSLSQGKISEAVESLDKAVKNFDSMDQKEKEKAAKQMANLAKSVQKAADDPKVQKQMEQQLKQMGATQQQAQQMTKQIQQAANGDKQAQQQIQQMATQLAQQQNQNGKATPQQQRAAAQQVQQAIKQMQAQANTQAGAQQMAQSAQALAKAMQQQAGQGGTPTPGQKGQPGGGQPGQGGQQMAQAGAQMQQQLGQMQAMANDQQAVAAGQKNDGQQGGGQQQNPGQNGQGRQAGGPGQGQWAKGDPQNKQGQGFGGPGQAAGGRPPAEVAPFSVKDEVAPTERDENGKILASTFVKSDTIKGESKAEVRKMLPSVEKEASDEVDEQRVSRADAAVVRDYFGNIRKDTEK